MWERARELGRGKRKVDWQAIATQIVDELKTKWPERLSSRTAAMKVGCKLEVDPLYYRFRDLAKRCAKPSDLRAKAVQAIAEAGTPVDVPDGMTLWNFFKTNENVGFARICEDS